MDINLNSINFEKLGDDPNVAVKVSEVIDDLSWSFSNFEPLFGKGEKRPIRHYETKSATPYRPRLKAPLQGNGVVGNADFATNYDNLEIFAQTINAGVIGNSLLSEIWQYTSTKNIDFLQESTGSLADWMFRLRDNSFAAALANDPTNFVVADASSGFKDVSAKKNATTASSEVKAGDVMNVKALRRAIFMAQNGIDYAGKNILPLSPTHIESWKFKDAKFLSNRYVILLDTYQVNQLKADDEWKAIQNVDNRGANNNLISGFVGLIDGCPVIDMGVYSEHGVGLFNSSISDSSYLKYINKNNYANITTPANFKGNSVDTCMGFLLGAGALLHVGSENKFYVDKNVDFGRKMRCGVDRVLGIAKARFEITDSNSPYVYMDGKDFGTIALFSSKE